MKYTKIYYYVNDDLTMVFPIRLINTDNENWIRKNHLDYAPLLVKQVLRGGKEVSLFTHVFNHNSTQIQ